jgi:hypothetical protein
VSGHFLYSTNVFLKQEIQRQYRGDIHYVWCSEVFDPKTTGAYTSTALIAPSSSPAAIYRELRRDVDGQDMHSAKIAAQKLSVTKLAIDWDAAGQLKAGEKDEIIYMVQHAGFALWRPVLYVIPRDKVASRISLVPIANRAGFGPEYIISDLQRSEFDMIEL